MSDSLKELKVLDRDGQVIRSRAFGEGLLHGDVNVGLLHKVVRWQRAGWRAGTHSVLTRAQASGGGRKPWKQKGTGNARAGSNTSPLWVGGGIAHGPKVRSYEFSLNKQERKLAMIHALRARFGTEKLIVVDDIVLAEKKTKMAAEFVAKAGLVTGETVLVVAGENQKDLEICFRNIPYIKFVTSEGLNVYDILCRKYILITDGALSEVEGRLGVSGEHHHCADLNCACQHEAEL